MKRAEQGLMLAALLQVEVHYEQVASRIQSCKLISIVRECHPARSCLLRVGIRWWCIFIQDPLVETLICHLIEAPQTEESFGVATHIQW